MRWVGFRVPLALVAALTTWLRRRSLLAAWSLYTWARGRSVCAPETSPAALEPEERSCLLQRSCATLPPWAEVAASTGDVATWQWALARYDEYEAFLLAARRFELTEACEPEPLLASVGRVLDYVACLHGASRSAVCALRLIYATAMPPAERDYHDGLKRIIARLMFALHTEDAPSNLLVLEVWSLEGGTNGASGRAVLAAGMLGWLLRDCAVKLLQRPLGDADWDQLWPLMRAGTLASLEGKEPCWGAFLAATALGIGAPQMRRPKRPRIDPAPLPE